MAEVETRGAESRSPHQLAFELHPFLSSIEAIATEHGLHHDSGVAFASGTGSGTGKGLKTGFTSKALGGEADQGNVVGADNAQASTSKVDGTEAPKTVATGPSVKRMMESPGVTGEFDARDDSWGDVTRRLKPFGDTLRHERLRSQLADTALAKDCVGLLNYSLGVTSDSVAIGDAQIEMMRVLANLCIDNKPNREKLLNVNAPQSVIRFIERTLADPQPSLGQNTLQQLRTAAGAALNLQLESAPTHVALRQDVNNVDALLKLAADERIYSVGSWYRQQPESSDAADLKKNIVTGASIATWAWRIVQDVCAGEGKDDEGQSKRPQSPEMEEEKTIESLVKIGAPKVIERLLTPFKAFVASTNAEPHHGDWDGDDVCDRMEADVEILQIGAELVESCSFDSHAFRIAALRSAKGGKDKEATPLAFLLDFLESAVTPKAWSEESQGRGGLPPPASDPEVVKEVQSSFAQVKAAVARAIVGIVADDDNMSSLFEAHETGKPSWFIERMKRWMAQESKSRDDLVSTAMLAVGNLARKDTHCIALVHEHDLVPTLTASVTPTADIKVAHGVVCLLKNLAIPATNKQIIGTSNDLIERLSPFLEKEMDKVQPLQFAAVGLLKHLCGGCLVNAQTFVQTATKDSLLALLARTDDVPTRMEGTRVLVNAIKTIWSSRPDGGVAGGDKQAVRQQLCTESVAMALSEMVKGSTKYPVLVNEGILALTLIASQRDSGKISGASLVAKALQTLRPSRKTSSLSERSAKAASKTGEEGSSEKNEDKEEAPAPPPRLPQRQTTLDALASTTNQVLPAPRTGADMIATVLLRRDARMPPQFANNACSLVQTLVSADGGDDGDGGGRAFIGHLVQAWRPALGQLSKIGPQETMPLAQRALHSVQSYLDRNPAVQKD